MKNPIKKLLDVYIRDITSFASPVTFGFLFLLSILLKRYNLAAQFFLTIFGTWILFSPIRYFIYRPRPKEESYHNLLERLDASSFPSLHATRAIMLAMILSQLFVQIEARVMLWASALLIIWSRLYLKKHHIEDVVVGALIGLGLGYLLILFV